MKQHVLNRILSREVSVGNLIIGGKNPIRIQSMTNTNTNDIKASAEQCIRIFNEGGELVRLTAQGIREAESLKEIRKYLHNAGYHQPLAADIHFNPKAAEIAANYVEKVRINPGNYIDKNTANHIELSDIEYQLELEKIHERLLPLINICKSNGTAIRIGTNHGSLSSRIMNKYGDTPKGMVISAMEFLRIFEAEHFHNLVLSMKSSNTRVLVYANRLLVQTMQNEGMNYPVHLGLTEAGAGEDGRIKSALGIASLLTEGIGDTIRISLTEDPENEIPVAKKLVDYYRHSAYCNHAYSGSLEYKRHTTEEHSEIGGSSIVKVIGNKEEAQCKADFDEKILDNPNFKQIHIQEGADLLKLKKEAAIGQNPVILNFTYDEKEPEKFHIRFAADAGVFLIDGIGDAIKLNNKHFSEKERTEAAFNVLQAARIRFSKTEYISCPGCGRTLFNLQQTLEKIKSQTSHLKNLKLGIMGCIVNGPGEMADADYGYVGAGKGKITLYKGKEVIKKNIPEEEALEELIGIIRQYGDWVDA